MRLDENVRCSVRSAVNLNTDTRSHCHSASFASFASVFSKWFFITMRPRMRFMKYVSADSLFLHEMLFFFVCDSAVCCASLNALRTLSNLCHCLCGSFCRAIQSRCVLAQNHCLLNNSTTYYCSLSSHACLGFVGGR